MSFYKKLLLCSLVVIGAQAGLQAMDYANDAAVAATLNTVAEWQSPSISSYLPLTKKIGSAVWLIPHFKELKAYGKSLKQTKTGIVNIVHDVVEHCKNQYKVDFSKEEDIVVNASINVKSRPEMITTLAAFKRDTNIPVYLIAMDQDTKEAAIWLEQLKQQGRDIESLVSGKLTQQVYSDKFASENEDYGMLSKHHFVSKRLKTHPGFYKAMQALIGNNKKIYFIDVDQNRINIATRQIDNLEGILASDAKTLQIALAEIKRKQGPIKYDELD